MKKTPVNNLTKAQQYYIANRTHILKRMKAYYNKDNKNYYYSHPEKFNTTQVRYAFSKLRAKKRDLEFNISINDYTLLLKKPCFYCLEPLSNSGVGLDRIDNSKGYQIDNVLPCCGRCNTSRQDNFTVEEWKFMMTAFIEFKKKI